MKQFIISLIPGTCVAFASIFLYVQPPECVQEIECQVGVQRGGFPLAVVKDKPGSSPISGWGRISLEDFYSANPLTFLVNSLCYTTLFWVMWKTGVHIQRK